MEQKNRYEKEKEADLKLYSAFRLIEENNLLYFRVMKKLNFIVQPEFPYVGAVAFNKKNNKIYITLQEEAVLNGDAKDIAGLCEHECGHILYEHIFNQMAKVDHQMMNVANVALL